MSRAGNLGEDARDPSTAAEKAAAASYVASERRLPDPDLTSVPVRQPRTSTPQDRYAMAGGCYSLAGDPIFFQATDLGDYLLYDADKTFVTGDGGAGGRARRGHRLDRHEVGLRASPSPITTHR